jgi:acetyltransferase-like isoleucine patch superfamily enzyme
MTLFRRRDIWRDDPLRILKRISIRLYTKWMRSTYPLASIGRNVEIDPSWDIRKYLAHRVSLGSSIVIAEGVQFGISCADPEEKGEPVIVLEDNVGIGSHCQISAKNCIHMERDVMVASRVLIMDHNHAYKDVTQPIRDQGITEGGRIRIGQGSWIGSGAAIVCNSGELTLGRNCVVGANALVTRSFPPYSVIFGNPAIVLQQYDPIKQVWVMGPVRSTEPQLTK